MAWRTETAEGEVTMLNQNRVQMKLELLERQQYIPAIEMVEVD